MALGKFDPYAYYGITVNCDVEPCSECPVAAHTVDSTLYISYCNEAFKYLGEPPVSEKSDRTECKKMRVALVNKVKENIEKIIELIEGL